jgi:hypothetical protein
MDPILFPVLLAAVAAFITLLDKIPRSTRKAIGGLILVILVLDSLILGLRAVLP